MSYSILVIYICLYMFHTYNLHMLMQSYTFLSYHVSFQVVYIFLLLLVNMYLSLFTYHHIAMLCFSYHVMYFYHVRIIFIYLSFVLCFMPALTLEVDKGNYKGPKALLSLYETMTIYKGPKALLSLYETMTIYKGPKAL